MGFSSHPLCHTVSVPVAEVVGVEEGRVEVLPHKSVEDTDRDFTGINSQYTATI